VLLSVGTGIVGGLARLGFVGIWAERLALAHGPLLVVGGFSTMIALERAIGSRAIWPFGAPLLFCLSSIGLLAGSPWAPGAAAGASTVLVAVNATAFRRRPTTPSALLAAGAISSLAAALGWWTGSGLSQVAPAWTSFLVLTILAERLRLLGRTATLVSGGR
jgi:hypothetical protein